MNWKRIKVIKIKGFENYLCSVVLNKNKCNVMFLIKKEKIICNVMFCMLVIFKGN